MDLRVVMASRVGGGRGDDVYGLSCFARCARAAACAVTRSVERGSLLGAGGTARRASSTAALPVNSANVRALTALVRTSKRRYAQRRGVDGKEAFTDLQLL